MRRVGKVGRRQAAALRKLKPFLIARSGNRCEVPWCRKRAKLDPHHHPKRSRGGHESLEGIFMLCRRCHDATDLPGGQKLGVEVFLRPDGRSFAVFTQGDLIRAIPLA